MGLEKLLYLQGVGAEFVSCSGENIYTPEQDRIGILRCMLDAGITDNQQRLSDDMVASKTFELDALPWTQPLPSFQHCSINAPLLSLYLPENTNDLLNIRLQLESGDVYQFSLYAAKLHCHIGGLVNVVGNYQMGAVAYLHYQLSMTQALLLSALVRTEPMSGAELPYIGLGYHRVSIELENSTIKGEAVSGTWLVAPATTYQGSPSRTTLNDRLWGLSIQLFSLRSDTQWGIGDFADLLSLIAVVAKEGASFILLNPLHALDIASPQTCSPYSPSDRRRLNPLYINIEMVPEFELLLRQKAKGTIDSGDVEFESELLATKALVNATDWLDYRLVSSHKYRIFTQLYRLFVSGHVEPMSARARRFNAFIAEKGEALMQFCDQQVADTQSLSEFEGLDNRFFAYLQFVAEQQLSQCQGHAKQLGMSIGLVRDLAVGAAANSVEVQAGNNPFCQQASIGAPPDPFAPQGQNWGLTPLDPIALKHSGYQHFIYLLRANMQSCGALRIDHVMSLLRLWWWPASAAQGNGAYVYYPLDALLAILCIESQRARCRVIGEDLGLIPPEIVSKLFDAGVLSNDLFYFSKQDDAFTLPENYKPQSLMMLANHDVPPLLAWWQADDLHLRHKIGLIDTDTDKDSHLQHALSHRQHEKQQLLTLLCNAGALSHSDINTTDYSTLLPAWISVCAAGTAGLFSVQLSDLVQDNQPVNIPGTWLEYPNWQRRMPVTLEVLAAATSVKALFKHLRLARASASVTDAQTPPCPTTLSPQSNGLNRYD
ncbi:4-alpha-glucanotransferase [Shewanella sp. Choline-02u-19]|uniref:4-alpha-glucanotransferase n=1 Tax=unclassified Shewanella TaxID=196818 RepID=UPI000C34F133|nr:MULTISPECIES: 4-alpha-glucanotransferase [unclassified Shewanella]PKH57376.1 4-alpha-glucanotransferase [Shewanella sp. Bg11-22]PKI28323.1 4-alpha-glucanotransferase [Shewanella sp. Choline-02u-19]